MLGTARIMREELQNWRERLRNSVRLGCRLITVCM